MAISLIPKECVTALLTGTSGTTGGETVSLSFPTGLAFTKYNAIVLRATIHRTNNQFVPCDYRITDNGINIVTPDDSTLLERPIRVIIQRRTDIVS